MKILESFVKSLLSVLFPIFVVINLYVFLIHLDPSYNFLGVTLNTPFYNTQQRVINEVCPYGGSVTFTMTSFNSMISDLNTDNIFNVLRNFFNSIRASFISMDFDIVTTLPALSDNPNIIDFVRGIYYGIAILNFPIVSLFYGAIALGEFATTLVGDFFVFMSALGGAYSRVHCYTYPTFM